MLPQSKEGRHGGVLKVAVEDLLRGSPQHSRLGDFNRVRNGMLRVGKNSGLVLAAMSVSTYVCTYVCVCIVKGL